MKLLFFNPFSGVLPFVRVQVKLAGGLQKMGHEVVVFDCDGIYQNFCITMSAHRLTESSDAHLKLEQCRMCKRVRDSNNSRFDYAAERIDSGFTQEDSRIIHQQVQSVTPLNWTDFSYDGLPTGRIASYEFLINHKKNNFSLSDSEFSAYETALRNTLATQLVMGRALKRTRPDRILMFDSGYSVNGMVKALADQMGIAVYDFRLGPNMSTQFRRLSLSPNSSISQYEYLRSDLWPRVRHIPVGKSEVRHVVDHFRALFKATNVFVYSSPRGTTETGITARFGAIRGQKILVAALSSYDERFAGSAIGTVVDGTDALFSSQESWCRALIEWVQNRPEYFLIIRTHPREFPNKREGVMAAQVQRLQSLFEHLPSNVAINWPTDNISVYDLAEETDVFLTAWSTVGVEMSLLGLPVVAYSETLFFYPVDLNFVGTTLAEYFRKIDEAVAIGWTFEKMRMTFRWLSLLYSSSTIDAERKPLFPRLGQTIQRGLRMAGKKLGWRSLLTLADRMFIDQWDFDGTALKKIEEVLLNRRNSLADVADAAKDPVSLQEEAECIRTEMEDLFRGIPSKVVLNLRARFAITKGL